MNYKELPYAGEVNYLWSLDWYDGPLSGLCECQGKKYWFYFADDLGYNWAYTLHELPPEQLTDAEHWRNLLVEKISCDEKG